MSVLDDYQELNSTGVSGGGGGDQTPPEEEFFKSIYISGQNRKHDQTGIMEEIEKIQIRGHSYNHTEVYMIITHVKDVLNHEHKVNGRKQTKCFSFKESSASPWYGSVDMSDGSPRVCPTTSKDRKQVEFCKDCKAQIIMAGILVQPTGQPILDTESKPIFVFIRGKGVKYGNVSDYLSSLYQLDMDNVFNEEGDAIREFEKRVVNHKRFTTKITKTTAQTDYGMKMVFALEKGAEIPKEMALELLEMAKNTMPQFRKKFDWSKKKKSAKVAEESKAAGVMSMDGDTTKGAPQESTLAPDTNKEAESEKPTTGNTFSFKDIKF